jgi:hypothetical protein
MLALKTANKALYIKTGLVCHKCLLVIDFKAVGHRRMCKSCRTGN